MSKLELNKKEETQGAAQNVFTYVGKGEDCPNVIKFMGRVEFVRGEPVTVTDPEVLAKLKVNPSFVQGAVERKELAVADAEAKKAADAQRKADSRMNAAFTKKFKSE